MAVPISQEHLNNQLVQQLQQMQQQLTLLQSGQGRVPGAPREPRMAPPPPCDGKAATIDGWLAALERQFAWYGYTTPAHDGQRLRLATTVLTGDAWDWWSHHPAPPTSWVGLVDALRARFQPVTSAETARAKLATLAQGKASVNEYISSFRRLLIAVPTMGEDDRLFHFTRGLRPAIATQLRVHGVTSLAAAIEMAARIGSLGELAAVSAGAPSAAGSAAVTPMDLDALGIEGLEPETGAEEGATTGASADDAPVTRAEFAQLLAALQASRRPASHKAKFGTAASGSSAPMHRDEAGRLKFGTLTQSQMDAHFTAGTCFACGKAGHRARQCPKNKSSN